MRTLQLQKEKHVHQTKNLQKTPNYKRKGGTHVHT